MDVLDAAIHPMLLPEIVRWFHDRSAIRTTRNSG